MKVKNIKIKDNNSLLTILKGALNALIISLVAILIFAFIIKLTSISDALIKPVNQVIKVVSILFGSFMALKKSNEKTLFKGLLIGVCYIILAFVLFSTLNGSFQISSLFVLDIVFGASVGVISAIICNVLKKR